jgi:serine/threonine protein kinase
VVELVRDSDTESLAIAATAPMTVVPEPEGGEPIRLYPAERFELIRVLGRGGMGEVYLARDLRLGRLVALKLMHSQHDGHNQHLLDEAQATARCHHENIVVIHEVGEHDGHPYMVLEYLPGQTLRQWLREHAAATAAPGQPATVPPRKGAISSTIQRW